MSDARKLKAFQVTLHAYQHEIDLISVDLSKIRSEQAALQNRIAALDHRRDTEGFANTPEAQPFVAGFLQAVASVRANLVQQLSLLDKAAEEHEEKLRAKFIEHRSWKVSCDRLQTRIDAEARRKDDAEMEEVARAMFMHAQRY